MHGLIARSAYLALIQQRLQDFPAVALLGARQVGKSTLARTLLAQHDKRLYLDPENQADLNKLTDPDAYFQQFRAGQGALLICIDEVQRAPELFAALRVAIDRNVVGLDGQLTTTDFVCVLAAPAHYLITLLIENIGYFLYNERCKCKNCTHGN